MKKWRFSRTIAAVVTIGIVFSSLGPWPVFAEEIVYQISEGIVSEAASEVSESEKETIDDSGAEDRRDEDQFEAENPVGDEEDKEELENVDIQKEEADETAETEADEEADTEIDLGEESPAEEESFILETADEIGISSSSQLAEALSELEDGSSVTYTLTDSFELNQPLVFTGSDIKVQFESAQGKVVLRQTTEGEPHFLLDGVSGVISFENIELNGNGIGGGLTVADSESVTIENLYVTNSKAEQGGGIRIENSQVVLKGGEFAGNEAVDGGGIAILDGSEVTLKGDVVIRENLAYSENVRRSSMGGGIFIGEDSHAILEAVEISANKAETIANSWSMYGSGGGLAVDSTSAVTFSGNIMIGGDDSEEGNTAQIGGGIYYADGNPHELKLGSGVKVYHNQATYNGTPSGGVRGNGGGILLCANNNAVIDGAEIMYNYSARNGGGIDMGKNTELVILSGKIEYNSSNMQGGGIRTQESTVVTMEAGSISHNEAITSNGGGICAYHVMNGSGLTTHSYVYLNGGEVSHNTAKHSAGGIYGKYIIIDGGKVDHNYVADGLAPAINGHTVELKSGSISNNLVGITKYGTAVDCYNFIMSGGEVANNRYETLGSTYAGGAIVVSGEEFLHASSLLITGGVIRDNAGGNGGAVSHIYEEEPREGDRTSVITGGTFENNQVTQGGGAVYISGMPLQIAGDAVFSRNTATLGGAIYHEDGRLTIGESVKILDNHAERSGGGVYFAIEESAEARELQMLINGNVELSGNSAEKDGGALLLHRNDSEDIDDDLYIITGNVELKDNEAGGNGGAVQVEELQTISVKDSVIFENNQASVGWWMTDEEDIELHNRQIKTENFTSLFEYGFNNYDINYQDGFRVGPWTVTYNENYGDNEIYFVDEYATIMEPLTRPEDPQREGYRLFGWYKDPETNRPWGFDTDRVTGDITLYARWIEDDGGNEGGGNEGGGNEDGGNEGGGNGGGSGGGDGGKDPAEETELPRLTDEHRWYVQGYPDNSFRAENSITRAEIATIFFNLIDAEDKNTAYNSAYTDADQDAWYYKAVAYVEHYDIMKGYPDGTFRPYDAITRAELATVCSVFFELEGGSHPFADVDDAHWAERFIANAYAKGWIKGYPDGTFQPDQSTTRAETVTMLNGILDRKLLLEDIPTEVHSYTDLTRAHWAYAEIMEASHSHDFERKDDGYEIWTEFESPVK